MSHAFPRRVQLWLLLVSVMGLGGCANLMEVMPSPPGISATVQLDGPYDKDIPTRYARQIKSASFIKDWTVPYIFLRVGIHFESIGDEERSIHFFDRAGHEFRKRHNTTGEGSAFSRKISARIRSGQIQKAYLEVDELERRWTSPPLNAFVYYNYANYYLKNGDYAKARVYFSQALAASPNDSDDPDLLALRRDVQLAYGMTLIMMDYFSAVSGRIGLQNFDDDFYRDIRRNIFEILSCWEHVSRINEKIKNTKLHHLFPEMVPSSMACDVLNYRGLSHGIAGQRAEAVKNLEAAAKTARKTDYPLGEADSILFLNHVHLLDQQDRSEGLRALQALAEVADRYQLVSYSIWMNLMSVYYAKSTGDTDQALRSMDRALSVMEENMSWFAREAGMRGVGFFNTPMMYEALVDMHAAKGGKQEAFQTTERAKAAQLVHQLSGEVAGKSPDQIDAVSKVHFYRQQLTEHCRTILSSSSTSTAFRDAVEKIKQARITYANLVSGIKEKDESLYSVLRVSSLETSDLQRLLSGNTTLFAYYAGEQYLYVWVISRNGFHQEKIQMSRKDVEQLADAYRSAIISRDKMKSDSLAEKAYDAFLRPVIHYVYGDQLGFLPCGNLHDLPFASMRYVQSYLVDGFTIFYLPHAGMLKPVLEQQPAVTDAKKVMSLADTRCAEKKLSHAYNAEDLGVLKKIFPKADHLLLTTFSEDVVPVTGNYETIHWISYGCSGGAAFNEPYATPDSTQSERGCPTLGDIFRLQWSSRTAFLSSCRMGRIPAGEKSGVSGLTSAWLYTVSPQVVTQLWEVEDRARALLMGMYYDHLKKSGNAADSLRAAQNGMIQLGYGPSDWAAFIVTGRY